MKTFIYTPKVRVVIARGNRQIDVSRDIVRCSLHRAESSAASFLATLANKNWKYTPGRRPVFHRMDRIVVTWAGPTHPGVLQLPRHRALQTGVPRHGGLQ